METLIVCFVLSPIMFKGKRIVDELVELTKEQVKGFQKVKPCPIRVVASDNKENFGGAGSEPVSTELGTDANTAPPTPEPVPEPTPEPVPAPEPEVKADADKPADNEPAAKAEAKARNKAAKS